MIGTAVDTGAALLVGTGAWRGRNRKLSGELSRLVGVGVAFVLGCGAFKGLDQLAADGRLGFVGAFVGGLIGVQVMRRILIRKGRHATRDFLDRTISEKTDRRFGMVAGGLRSLLLAAVGVGAAYLTPLEGVHRALQEESLLGKTVGAFIADEEIP